MALPDLVRLANLAGLVGSGLQPGTVAAEDGPSQRP